jgi:hypothetical protein
VSDDIEDTSDDSDYEPTPDKWGLLYHESSSDEEVAQSDAPKTIPQATPINTQEAEPQPPQDPQSAPAPPCSTSQSTRPPKKKGKKGRKNIRPIKEPTTMPLNDTVGDAPLSSSPIQVIRIALLCFDCIGSTACLKLPLIYSSKLLRPLTHCPVWNSRRLFARFSLPPPKKKQLLR